MSSTHKPYNKRFFVKDQNGNLVKRENACFDLAQNPDRANILLASDRAYKVMRTDLCAALLVNQTGNLQWELYAGKVVLWQLMKEHGKNERHIQVYTADAGLY